MNHDFKRTFDVIKLSSKRQEEIKSELSSRLSEKHKENYFMTEKTISFKKSRLLVIA